MPGPLLQSLGQWWRRYKYRFVPWIAMNLSRNPRTLRYVPEELKDKVISDEDVLETLLSVFQALFLKFLQTNSYLDRAAKACSVKIPRPAIISPASKGTVYQKYEPIFFQSIGNPFIFRCLDGILIDGNDKGISKVVYRSFAGRDRLGPLRMSDSTWLTAEVQNPLAVGQYVNNCSNERPANACYQELGLPAALPVELKRYLPNVAYGCDQRSPLRCVVLVALRDIGQGEELLSNYYTVVR